MSMKPRLEEDNKGIPNLASDPNCHDGNEHEYQIGDAVTHKSAVPNQRLTPNAVTAPKTFGN